MTLEGRTTLDAETLGRFQQCARRYALEREYKYLRWRPRKLLETILRDAIFKLSSGADHATVSAEACTRFLEQAARPGLDIPTDPFTLARDYCAIIQNSLEAISRLVLLKLKLGPMVDSPHGSWQCASFQDESGILHRWITCERWDDDTKYANLHSHDVFGDCAAAQVGMTLHVIEIGKQSRGHQHTAWARAFKHPVISGRYRFRKVDGTPLEPSWKPIWYQDSDQNKPATWVDLMEHDRLGLIHHVDIREPRQEYVAQFWRELKSESARMGLVDKWEDAAMSRGACDMPYTCAFQPVCYAPPGLVNVEGIGGFARRQSVAG